MQNEFEQLTGASPAIWKNWNSALRSYEEHKGLWYSRGRYNVVHLRCQNCDITTLKRPKASREAQVKLFRYRHVRKHNEVQRVNT